MAKNWGFLRETTELAKKAGIDYRSVSLKLIVEIEGLSLYE